jgi:hypothetical protein
MPQVMHEADVARGLEKTIQGFLNQPFRLGTPRQRYQQFFFCGAADLERGCREGGPSPALFWRVRSPGGRGGQRRSIRKRGLPDPSGRGW